MKKITHIIRVKKFEPKYEIYEVKDNITKFIQSFNKYEDQLVKFSYTRIVLSSVLCVEGNRDLPSDKKLKLNENEFYFSHQILSSAKELQFSPAIIDKKQLKQFWLDEKEYSNLVKPLIIKIKDNVECIISEKSCLAIKRNENIELQDGKIINVFKLNEDGLINNELSKQFLGQNNKNLSGISINTNISNAPKIETKRFAKFNRLWISILLFFVFLNFLVLTPKFFPLTELRISYLLNDLKIKKIINSQELINREKIILENLNRNFPEDISKINSLIETMPMDLMENLLTLELESGNKVLIKFKNFNIKNITEFLNKNNILETKTNIENNILSLTIEFN